METIFVSFIVQAAVLISSLAESMLMMIVLASKKREVPHFNPLKLASSLIATSINARQTILIRDEDVFPFPFVFSLINLLLACLLGIPP